MALADMVSVAYRKSVDPAEKQVIMEYARSSDIKQGQLNRVRQKQKRDFFDTTSLSKRTFENLRMPLAEFPF